MDRVPREATKRALSIANRVLPRTGRTTDLEPIGVGLALFARCVTSSEACLHLERYGRRADLMVLVRTLYEHVVTFAWLVGIDDDLAERMLLFERYSFEQELKIADDIVRLGGNQVIPEKDRAMRTGAIAELGNKRMPGLPDRAAQADKEWEDRLGTDPTNAQPWSFRGIYPVVFRGSSAMAHPTMAGARLMTEVHADRRVVSVEPAGKAHEALMPVPILLASALIICAHWERRGDLLDEMLEYSTWLAEQNPGR